MLTNRCTSDNDIEYVEEDFLADFLVENEITSFSELFFKISQCDVKNVRTFKKTKLEQIKMISIIHMQIMDFPGDKFDKKTLVSKTFFDSVLNLIFGDVVLHHSHINGKIFGYAHDVCTQKVKESRSPIPVIAHNLFKFDFFCVLKGLRLCVWRTKNISKGGRNLTDIQYANISDQVKLIDVVKYYQQSLANVAENCDKIERENIKKSSLHFLENHPKYCTKFKKLTENEKKFIEEYLSVGKGVIPYEKVKNWSDLDSHPNGEFFAKTEFFSSLNNSAISDFEYDHVKKFWQTLSFEKLSELNDVYNFQDTIILCEIFENRATEMSRRFPYSPRKCTPASRLSGCIHRYLSKAIISFPTNSEVVELFEKTLIGGMSSVNTRLAFDSSLLVGEKEQKLIYNIRNK